MLRMLRRSNVEASAANAGLQPQEFNISIEKASASSSLGLSLNPLLVVTAINAEGLVATWNNSNPGREVRVGHRIIQVNAHSEIAEITEKLKEQEFLEMRVSREGESAYATLSVDTVNGVGSQDVDPTSSRTSSRGVMKKPTDHSVTSEEIPSPHAGINQLKHEFDACNEMGEGDGKDGDVVELPSASVQTSLLMHSSLSPQDMKMSMNSALSPGDLQALRDLAEQTSAAKADVSTDQASATAAAREMWTVSSTGLSGPLVPAALSSPLIQAPNGNAATSSSSSAYNSPERGTSLGRHLSFGSPPDDNEGNDVAPVHSSLSTSSPSLHETLHQNAGKTSQPQGQEALFTAIVANKNDPRQRSDQLQTHGTGSTVGTVGFTGGPFWTCGSTPHTRAGRQKKKPGFSNCGEPSLLSGLFHNSAPQAAAAMSGPFDLSSRISGAIGNCIDMLSSAIDVSDDPEPPEDELTTVLMETKEQRLQWRDFLSEAVSKCRAGSLYNSFDVEPDPPRYARPPLSSAPKVDAIVRSYRQTGKSPPHVVAPRGAGWSPIGPHSGGGVDERSLLPYAYSGLSNADPDNSAGSAGGASSSVSGVAERSAMVREASAASANGLLPVLGAPATASPVRSWQGLLSEQEEETKPARRHTTPCIDAGAEDENGLETLLIAGTGSLRSSPATGMPADANAQPLSSSPGINDPPVRNPNPEESASPSGCAAPSEQSTTPAPTIAALGNSSHRPPPAG